MSLPSPSRRLSEADYLEVERRADFKSEFFDGEMFAMAGGSPAHSLIAANVARELGNRLKGSPCVVFNSDLRLKVEATVEVLSEATEASDRGKKFENYRRLPSLCEYLLVSQGEPRLEQFIRREHGNWELREAFGLEATLELPSLSITLALAEVFANVAFVPTSIRASTARSTERPGTKRH